MDPAHHAALLRELHQRRNPSSSYNAALRLLGVGLSVTKTSADGMLLHDLRRKCREVLDSNSRDSRPSLTPEEAQLLSRDDSLAALPIEDIFKLPPYSIFANVDVDKINRHMSKNTEHKEIVQRPKQLSSSAWLKPAKQKTNAMARHEELLNGRPGSWGIGSQLPHPLNDEDGDAEMHERRPPRSASSNSMLPPVSASENKSTRRSMEAQQDAPLQFESALKKIKSVPGFSRFGSLSAGSKDSADDADMKGRRGVRSSFVSPMRSESDRQGGGTMFRQKKASKESALDESTQRCLQDLVNEDGDLPDRLKNIEPKLIEQICNEILTKDTRTTWDDIAGLEHAKQCITETIIWPLKRPDLFRGTRAPSKGLLLFGPPGTGKTMIGRAIAGEIEATFFSISASSLTSKWIGEGEKLVRALFGVASCKQPAVIFIDEIDSLLSMRKSEGEHESSRRMKTQFLIEMEGCQGSEEQLLVIGATNRPQELDEAARRRLAKRLYIPLPESAARKQMVKHLLEKDHLLSLSEDDLHIIAEKTEGYSGSDMSHLVREASMVPLREAMRPGALSSLKKEDVRPVQAQDFVTSLSKVRPSVSAAELVSYLDWNKEFGSAEV